MKRKTGTAVHVPVWCAPGGIRIRVLALKGPRPGPLDDGGLKGDRVPVQGADGRPGDTPRFYQRC